MATIKPGNVDDYIASFPQATQLVLEQIRSTIKKAVPEAAETINYAMPAFTINGHNLVYFAGYKNHVGLYPVPTDNKEFINDFSLYKTSGKGTIQFPLEKPMPLNLIIRIVQFRAKERLQREAKRK